MQVEALVHRQDPGDVGGHEPGLDGDGEGLLLVERKVFAHLESCPSIRTFESDLDEVFCIGGEVAVHEMKLASAEDSNLKRCKSWGIRACASHRQVFELNRHCLHRPVLAWQMPYSDTASR